MQKHTFIKTIVAGCVLGAVLCTPSVAKAAPQETKIVQLSGNSSSETSIKINRYALGEIKRVYIANNNTFADALTGGVLAGETDAAVIFTDGNSLSDRGRATVANAETVTILGGENAVSKELEASLGKTVQRIYGYSRFDTAVEVAKALGTNRDIAVVSGMDYADAISATALSMYEDRNILLVTQDSIPTATKEYILEYGRDRDILFVGGELAISSDVKAELYDLAGKDPSEIESHTLQGQTRYDTSIKVARRFDDSTSIILTTGENYADALSASALSENLSAPIVLVRGDQEDNLVEFLSNHPTDDITILGGNNAVSVEMVQNIVARAKGLEDARSVVIIDETGQVVELASLEAPEEPSEEAPVEIEAEEVSEKEEAPEEEESTSKKESTSARQRFIDAALEMEGFRYSQSSRMSKGFADCSSLVLRAMINSGVTESKSNLTTRSISSDSRFYEISKSELEPGDILWRSGHIAIYMGGTDTFEARYSTGMVGYSSMGSRFSKYYRIKGL